jgi:hypothetical protein
VCYEFEYLDSVLSATVGYHGADKVMDYKQLLFPLILGLSLVVNSGCPAIFVGAAAGGAAGAGAAAYVDGELKSTEEVSLNRAWKATERAMRDLNFRVTDKAKDALGAQLKASGAGGKKIQVALKSISKSRTEIGIRVGTFGDESLSVQILDTIKKRF